MESVSYCGRSPALCGHPSGKLVGWTSEDYPGSQGQVQEEAVARCLSHRHHNPQLPHLFFRLRTRLVGVASPTVSNSDFSYFRLGPGQLPPSL